MSTKITDLFFEGLSSLRSTQVDQVAFRFLLVALLHVSTSDCHVGHVLLQFCFKQQREIPIPHIIDLKSLRGFSSTITCLVKAEEWQKALCFLVAHG